MVDQARCQEIIGSRHDAKTKLVMLTIEIKGRATVKQLAYWSGLSESSVYRALKTVTETVTVTEPVTETVTVTEPVTETVTVRQKSQHETNHPVDNPPLKPPKKKPKNKKTSSPPKPSPSYPPELNRLAWQAWIDYRKRIKKPYKTLVGQQQAIDWLVKQGDGVVQDEVIRQSIRNEWQGLFTLKRIHGKGGSGENSWSQAERIRARATRATEHPSGAGYDWLEDWDSNVVDITPGQWFKKAEGER